MREPIPVTSRKPQRLGRLLFAMFACILLGGAAGSGARQIMRSRRDVKAPHPAVPRTNPFVIERRSAAFRSLREALTAAVDGDTITILDPGPFPLDALVSQGKSLTVRAANGIRPRLLMKTGDDPWRALLQTDRALTLHGLDLMLANSSTRQSQSPAPPLILSLQAPLYLSNCRLQGGAGGTAIIARNPRELVLKGCEVESGSVGLSLEAGHDEPCRLEMIECRLKVREESGAAISLWSAEGEPSVPIEVLLHKNDVHAGRILAVRSLAKNLDIEARDNQFLYRTALLSYTDCPSREAWRGTAWRGGGNAYQGPSSWLWVEGRAVSLPAQGSLPQNIKTMD